MPTAPARPAPPAPNAPHATGRRGRWYPVALWLHRWCGLVATPFFLVLCLTGSVLVFHVEVDRFLGDIPPAAAEPARPLGLAALAAAGQRQAPGQVVRYVGFTPGDPDRAMVGVSAPNEHALEKTRPLLLARGDGRPLAFSDPEATFTGVLLKLHREWFAGVPGELFGGLVALLVLVALVTGCLVYSPFGRRFAFGAVRRGRGARIVQLDLHNLVGVVVLGWAAVVAVTGVCLGLGSIALLLWQGTELKAMAGGAPNDSGAAPSAAVSVDVASAAARAARPDRDLQFAIFPGTDLSSPRHYTFLMYGRAPYNERLFDVVLVDAATGRLAAARPLPGYLQAVALSGPLHFGDYGGLPLKLLWVASAWGALFVTGNGAWLWWARRRRPAGASVREDRPHDAPAAVRDAEPAEVLA